MPLYEYYCLDCERTFEAIFKDTRFRPSRNYNYKPKNPGYFQGRKTA